MSLCAISAKSVLINDVLSITVMQSEVISSLPVLARLRIATRVGRTSRDPVSLGDPLEGIQPSGGAAFMPQWPHR